MPVIQTSVDPGFDDFVSVMGDGLLRKADTLGHGFHVSAQFRIRKRDVRKRYRRAAPQVTVDPDLRRSDCKTRTFVDDARIYLEQFSRTDETPHLGFLDGTKKRHALEFRQRDQQPA